MKAQHMKQSSTLLTATLAMLSIHAAVATAAVTADEAAQLKNKLTPLGGERAGNKDGTIPEWDGGYKDNRAKAGAKRTDPYPAEKPLYAITAQNLAQHASKLSEGQP